MSQLALNIQWIDTNLFFSCKIRPIWSSITQNISQAGPESWEFSQNLKKMNWQNPMKNFHFWHFFGQKVLKFLQNDASDLIFTTNLIIELWAFNICLIDYIPIGLIPHKKPKKRDNRKMWKKYEKCQKKRELCRKLFFWENLVCKVAS